MLPCTVFLAAIFPTSILVGWERVNCCCTTAILMAPALPVRSRLGIKAVHLIPPVPMIPQTSRVLLILSMWFFCLRPQFIYRLQ